MRVLNENKFQHKKYNVFITSYNGLDYFKEWSAELKDLEDIQLTIIDCGNQSVANELDFPVYQTSMNIGCAGCWNMSSYIGFDIYKLNQIIIGQDDAKFTKDMIQHIWDETTDDTLPGAYIKGFDFSLFGLTKNFYATVGVFDENFIFVGCEDNDYTHRAKLFNKKIKCLGYSSELNSNISSTKTPVNVKNYNAIYLHTKWGMHYEYTHPFNDPSQSPAQCGIHSGLIDVYGNIQNFPTFIEIENFHKAVANA